MYLYSEYCTSLICVYYIMCSTPTSDSGGKDLLDCTRIHPETYEWARKMAVDALEYDEVFL